MSTVELPLVSVIMPMHNSERWLFQTLRSLAEQSYPNWELIAVDDGSTDSSSKQVSEFARRQGNRVRLIRTENGGPSSARNAALSIADGTYIALLDSDDIWLPSKLMTQTEWLRSHGEFIACTCNYAGFNSNSLRMERQTRFTWSQSEVLRWALLEGPGPGLCSALLVRRKIVERIGPFDDQLRVGEDTEYSLRLLEAGPIGFVDSVQMLYRKTAVQQHQNISATGIYVRKMLQEPIFSGNRGRQRRLASNASLLAGLRQWRSGLFMTALRDMAASLRASPSVPPRTIVRALLRSAVRRLAPTPLPKGLLDQLTICN